METTNFLTVHAIGKKGKIFETSINVESILDFYRDGDHTLINLFNGVSILTKESFDWIKETLFEFSDVKIIN